MAEDAPLWVPFGGPRRARSQPGAELLGAVFGGIRPDRVADQVKVIVVAPVVVIVPNQISTSVPKVCWLGDRLVQVATPPPEIDDTEKGLAGEWAVNDQDVPDGLGAHRRGGEPGGRSP